MASILAESSCDIGSSSNYSTVDINMDGDTDVIVGDGYFDNDGSGNFIFIPTSTNGIQLLPTDFDGDGDIDILATSYNEELGSIIVWYENNGDLNFIEHLVSTDGAGNIYAADMDADGYMDVLTSTYVAFTWFNNDGEGGFTENFIIELLSSVPFSIIISIFFPSASWFDLPNFLYSLITV